MQLMLVPPWIRPKLKEDRGVGSARRAGRERSREFGNRPAERVDRIAGAVIAPAMPARAGDGHFKAAAGQGPAGDVIGVGAVQNQEGFGPGTIRVPAQVAHAAQVALALLAHVGDQQGRQRRVRQGRRCVPGRGQRQQRGQAGAVVGNPGSQEPAVARKLDFVRRAGREHRIQVRRNRHGGAVAAAGQRGDHVARTVQARFPAQALEALRHPLGAFLLQEGRRRNPAQLEVLLVDPGALAAEPVERHAQFRCTGKISDRTGYQRHSGFLALSLPCRRRWLRFSGRGSGRASIPRILPGRPWSRGALDAPGPSP